MLTRQEKSGLSWSFQLINPLWSSSPSSSILFIFFIYFKNWK